MYVYVLKNDSISELVKIGYSNDPDGRARELTTTGVPGRWRVFARFRVEDSRCAEAAAHRALALHRDSKEFFRLEPADASERVAKAVRSWRPEATAQDDWARWADPKRWEAEQREQEQRLAERQREEERRRIEGEIKTAARAKISDQIQQKRKPIIFGILAIITVISILITEQISSGGAVFVYFIAIVAGFWAWSEIMGINEEDIDNWRADQAAKEEARIVVENAEKALEERWEKRGRRVSSVIHGHPK